MGALFNILSHSIGSFVLGSILTLIGMVLLFLIIKGWYRNATFTPQSFIVGTILFFLLAFQAILICGAVTIKGYCDEVEIFINSLVANIPDYTQFTQGDSQFILDKICEEVPIVGYYLNLADFHGHTPETIAGAMADEMRSYMNWFILRRIGWSLLYIGIGAFIVIKTMGIAYQRRRDAFRSSRTERSVRRHDGRAVGRSRRRR